MASSTSELEAQEVFNSVIKPELQHFRRVSEYYKEKADFTWIINDVNSFLNGSKDELESEVFPLTGYPFGARAKIELDDEDVWFHLLFKPLNNSNPEEEMQVIPRTYVTVKDQSGGKDRKDLIRANEFNCENKLKFNSYYGIGYLVEKSLLNSLPYNVDDQWAIDIHVEAPEVAQSVYSNDGTLIWAIEDFRKKKQAEADGLIEFQSSPYFYTGPKGYRRQVRMYLNGNRGYKNKGLSMRVAFLNDENHSRHFYRKTTVTIYHPTQPHKNLISESQEHVFLNDEWFQMGSDEIEGFLHNDTLYYKVTIGSITP